MTKITANSPALWLALYEHEYTLGVDSYCISWCLLYLSHIVFPLPLENLLEFSLIHFTCVFFFNSLNKRLLLLLLTRRLLTLSSLHIQRLLYMSVKGRTFHGCMYICVCIFSCGIKGNTYHVGNLLHLWLKIRVSFTMTA